MSEAEQSSEIPPQRHRRVINVTCSTCCGPRGFANLVMSKTPEGLIELDAHATGGCVLHLDEAASTEVRDQLSAWLGSGTAQR